jgi:hypothetical protein
MYLGELFCGHLIHPSETAYYFFSLTVTVVLEAFEDSISMGGKMQ